MGPEPGKPSSFAGISNREAVWFWACAANPSQRVIPRRRIRFMVADGYRARARIASNNAASIPPFSVQESEVPRKCDQNGFGFRPLGSYVRLRPANLKWKTKSFTF